MRVLSPSPGYSIQVFEGQEVREVDAATGAGYTRVAKQPLVIRFESGFGIRADEEALALSTFTGEFSGLAEGVNPLSRVSAWDSESAAISDGWDEKFHEKVCERVRSLASSRPQYMLVVEDAVAPKPWPTYDEKDQEEVLAYVDALGLNPETVLAYEVENAERAPLIRALNVLIEAANEEVATVSA